ncbi:Atlastin-1 [Halotydeus destructor]|nr:Atlastin-1 [Halotydeus destructor]
MADSVLHGILLVTIFVASVVPEPVQIVKVNDRTREFELDQKALGAILLQPKCKDKSISVISIAGATRKGKSFLLNFFLRYLKADGAADWLGDENSPLQGFSWRSGSAPDTNGIVMWSEPFIIKYGKGQEVAILLMDTQGAFDGKHTVGDAAKMFALSTMTASVQMFNIFHNIQEDDLQNLELFTEYGRLALKETSEAPFQKLVFLVRDWPFVDEFDYGADDGAEFLNGKLKTDRKQPFELQRVRKHIRSCFEEVDCFLMPHPGSKVATQRDFNGKLSDINKDFIKHLKDLVKLVLGKENIIAKKINGKEITGSELLEYFVTYTDIFAGGSLPEPKSMLEATAQANNRFALSEARNHYLSQMELNFGQSSDYVQPAVFKSRQEVFLTEAVKIFEGVKKLGGEEFSKGYLDKLKAEVEKASKYYDSLNHFKGTLIEQSKDNEKLKSEVVEVGEQFKKLEELREKDKAGSGALAVAREYYVSKMEASFGASFVSDADLHSSHNTYKNEAIAQLQSSGNSNDQLVAELSKEIGQAFRTIQSQNTLRKSTHEQTENNRVLQEEMAKVADRYKELQESYAQAQTEAANRGAEKNPLFEILSGAAKTLFNGVANKIVSSMFDGGLGPNIDE